MSAAGVLAGPRPRARRATCPSQRPARADSAGRAQREPPQRAPARGGRPLHQNHRETVPDKLHRHGGRKQSRDLLSTAGHCVWNGGFLTPFSFVPGYDNGSQPYGEWFARDGGDASLAGEFHRRCGVVLLGSATQAHPDALGAQRLTFTNSSWPDGLPAGYPSEALNSRGRSRTTPPRADVCAKPRLPPRARWSNATAYYDLGDIPLPVRCRLTTPPSPCCCCQQHHPPAHPLPTSPLDSNHASGAPAAPPLEKASAIPGVLIRGYAYKPAPGNAQILIRPAEADLFR